MVIPTQRYERHLLGDAVEGGEVDSLGVPHGLQLDLKQAALLRVKDVTVVVAVIQGVSGRQEDVLDLGGIKGKYASCTSI